MGPIHIPEMSIPTEGISEWPMLPMAIPMLTWAQVVEITSRGNCPTGFLTASMKILIPERR